MVASGIIGERHHPSRGSPVRNKRPYRRRSSSLPKVCLLATVFSALFAYGNDSKCMHVGCCHECKRSLYHPVECKPVDETSFSIYERKLMLMLMWKEIMGA
jgi:hypothetical protein